jgi:Flp pilus assembly protein TadG
MPSTVKQSVLSRWRRRFCKDQSGVIVVEFAYALPILTVLGLTGVEIANLAIANMRVSQIAITIADNVSRAQQAVLLQLPELREVDINDAFIGARIQGGASVPILTKGRIIVSSLQRTSTGRQTITWQRCKGELVRNSAYGPQGTIQPATGTSGFQGMGPAGAQVKAEPNTAIIFAEVTYSYQPLVASAIIGPRTLRKEAAFYVRDDRKLSGGQADTGVFNPSPGATPAACNTYVSTI